MPGVGSLGSILWITTRRYSAVSARRCGQRDDSQIEAKEGGCTVQGCSCEMRSAVQNVVGAAADLAQIHQSP